MRIVMIAFGSRGDVQPAIALAKGLRAAGHAVTLVAGRNFEAWVRSHGLDFVGTTDTEALMQSPQGIAWIEETNPLRQLGHMKKLFDANAEDLRSAVVEPAQGADLLISGFVSEPLTQAVSEKFGIPQINMTLQPHHPTRSGAATLMPLVRRDSSLLNLWLGYFAEWMIWSVAGETTNAFRASLGLPPHSARSYTRASRQIPTIFGFSRHVIPTPHDWSDHYHTAGYWFLDEHTDWQPPEPLARFLDAPAPPIYVGFGSMGSSDPQKTLNLIVAALREAGQRGIVAAGWRGATTASTPDFVHLVDHAPHEWLFERVAGVVHHGGAGTTAAGLRAGKPTLIVPHLGDQPFWARRVDELGVGIEPIPRHQLTVEKLAAGIQRLVTDAVLQANAARLGEHIRAERGVENGVRLIEEIAGK